MQEKEENKVRIEFAKELDDAPISIINAVNEEGEKVLRFYNTSDLGQKLKVNEKIIDKEENKNIYYSGKHILEMVFYHNESIDAVIHRLERLKKM